MTAPGSPIYLPNVKGLDDTLRRVLDRLPVPVCYVDRGQRMRFVNSAYEAWFGADRHSLIGAPVGEAPAFFAAGAPIDAALCGHEVFFAETHALEGSPASSLQVAYFPNLGPRGEIEGFFATLADPPPRALAPQTAPGPAPRVGELAGAGLSGAAPTRRAPLAPGDREARIQSILDTETDGILTVDHTGRIETASRAGEDMFGYQQGELAGQSLAVVLPDLQPSGLPALRSGRNRQPHHSTQVLGKRRDGTSFPAECAVGALPDPRRGFTVIVRDVSAREAARETLRRERDLINSLLEIAPVIVVILDSAGHVLRVNRHFEELSGYRREEVVGKEWFSTLLPEDQRAPIRRVFVHTVEGLPTTGTINRIRTKNGLEREIEWYNAVLKDETGKLIAVLAIGQDITERKRLHDVIEHQASLVENVSEAVFSADLEWRIRSWNRAAERLFGRCADEAIGRLWLDLVSAKDDQDGFDQACEVIRATGSWSGDLVLRTQAKRSLRVLASFSTAQDHTGQPYIVAAIRDVTELRELEKQLRHAQKMEAIGRLASGIAHDFNNLLMGISGCADIAAGRLEPDSAALPMIREVKAAATSGAAITRRLLAFSRKQDERKSIFDLGALVESSREILARLLGEDVKLDVHRDELGLWIDIDRGQLEQVLMNLAVNARDAMPGGGTLTVAASSRTLGKDGSPPRATLEPGEYAVLRVSDTGSGMDEETQQRLFEPFFTTKPAGEGTGLGLSTVYALVKRSAGHIDVESRVGQGSVFEILLPRVSPPQPEQEHSAREQGPQGFGKTVLLVEDDALVRAACRHYLEHAGFVVLGAQDGPSAIDLVRSHPGAMDLVVADVVLPELSGPEVASEVVARNPSAAVIYMSAHSREELVRTGRLPSNLTPVLCKPFEEAELLRAVAAALEQSALPSSQAESTILLVEDNRTARLATGELLRDEQFRVVEAASGAEAMAQARSHGGPIDLLLTDCGLPDTHGCELANRLRCLWPDLGVVYLSGTDAADPKLVEDLRKPRTAFFAKPIEFAEVMKTIHGLLSTRSPGAHMR